MGGRYCLEARKLMAPVQLVAIQLQRPAASFQIGIFGSTWKPQHEQIPFYLGILARFTPQRDC